MFKGGFPMASNDINKIKLHNIDFSDFIMAIDECKGDVFLETIDGDVVNLNSKLCQMIGLTTILSNTEIAEATLRCTNPDDESLLFRFNLYGKIPEKEFVIRFTILSTKKVGENEIPEKVRVQLLKSDIQLKEKDRIVKESTKDNFFDALDVGFVWLERNLKG